MAARDDYERYYTETGVIVGASTKGWIGGSEAAGA